MERKGKDQTKIKLTKNKHINHKEKERRPKKSLGFWGEISHFGNKNKENFIIFFEKKICYVI
jgi:hypothetical protein